MRRGLVAAREVARVLAFAAAPLLSAIAPLLVIPTIIVTHGPLGWSACAIGLAVGAAGAAVAELGWGVTGPQAIARAGADRQHLFALALASRLTAVALVAPSAGIAAFVLSSSSGAAAAAIAVGVTLSALSPAWFAIGLRRPVVLLVIETAPRLVLLIAVAAAIGAGAPLEVYGVALIVAPVVTLLLSLRLPGATWPTRMVWRAVPRTMTHQRTVIAGRVIGTVYTALPAAVLGGIAPGVVAAYAAVDRPLRMGLVAAQAVPARCQSWIGAASGPERRRRGLAAVVVNGLVGVVCAVVVVIGLEPTVDLLFVDVIQIERSTVIAAAVLAGTISLSRGLGLALVAHDRAGSITPAVSAAAVVGVSGLIVLTPTGGVTGALLALVAAEWTGIVVQAVLVGRVGRQAHRSSAPAFGTSC